MCKCNNGGAGCGLFAIAFVTALALGHAPEAFHFKQDSMRPHLRECFEHMESSPCSHMILRQEGATRKREKKCSDSVRVDFQSLVKFVLHGIWSGFIWTSVLLFLAEQKCATSSGSVLHEPLMFIADQKCESPFRVSSSNFILGGSSRITWP